MVGARMMLRTLLGLWTWFAFGMISFVGFFCCLVIFVFTIAFDPTRRWTGRGIRIVGRMMCGAVPAWNFTVQPTRIRPPERCICVSNHCSNIDPFLLAHLPWEMKYLAKAVLFRIPCVGWGMGIAGDIPLVRGSTQSIKRAMKKTARYVEKGMPVLIFPEGTRSPTGDLLPFKDGAFRLAIELRAAILPIAIAGTRTALKKGDWRPGQARGTCLVGQSIPTEGLSMSDVPQLKRQTRDAIDALRDELRAKGFET